MIHLEGKTKTVKNPVAVNKNIPYSHILFESLDENRCVFQNLCQQMASLCYASYVCTLHLSHILL